MCSRTVLLLLVGITSVLMMKVTRPGTDECYFVVNVPGKRMVSFANINWPDKYSSGEICQWIFHCPSETLCRLRCPDVGLPKTDDCYMDKLLVYSRGSPKVATTKRPSRTTRHAQNRTQLPHDHARMYCGRTTINVRSNATKIAMVLDSMGTCWPPEGAISPIVNGCRIRRDFLLLQTILISNEASPGGRFRCTVTPERVGPRKIKIRETEPPIVHIRTEKYDSSY